MRLHVKNSLIAALLLTLFSTSLLWATESTRGSAKQVENNAGIEEIDRDHYNSHRAYLSDEERMPAALKSSLRRLEAQSP